MKLFAVTLFANDLREVVEFYAKVFDKAPINADETSVLFQFESMFVNVIKASEAKTLMAPGNISPSDAGFTNLLTIQVESVDSEAERLKQAGVELVNGPVNQLWGIRALIFADPAGQAWEFSQALEPR